MDGFYEAPAGFFDKSVTDANISETYKLQNKNLLNKKQNWKQNWSPLICIQNLA